MNKLTRLFYLLAVVLLAIGSYSCSSDDNDDPAPGNNNPGDTTPTTGNEEKSLIIKEGAQGLELGQSTKLTAEFVTTEGTVQAATGVQWSSSDESVATVSSNGNVQARGQGSATITAKVTEGNTNFQSQVSVGVAQANLPFYIVPGAVVWEVDVPHLIALEEVYLGTGTAPTVSYSIADESVVGIGSGNLLEFKKAGETTITASFTLDGSQYTQVIPVLVVGPLPTPLPVARVEVSPNPHTIFTGESKVFTAKAFNSAGEEVTGETVVWAVKEDSAGNTLGTIDQSGNFTANEAGETTVLATIKGVTGRATVSILPEKFLSVEPFFVEVAAGGTQQFSANAYEVNKADTTYSQFTPTGTVSWFTINDIPFLPAVGTIDQNGLFTVNSNALPGLPSFVGAEIQSENLEGGAMILVKLGGVGPNPSTCGTGNPTGITITNPTINMSVTDFGVTIDATPVGDPAATIKYSTQDVTVISVNEDSGEVTPVGVGTGTVTLCSGSITETVTVNVSF